MAFSQSGFVFTRRAAGLYPVVLCVVFLALTLSDARSFERSSLTIETGNGAYTFDLEIARTAQEQGLGLMHRRSLPQDYAMLFPFERAREASFWMRNTFVSLDMVFIGRGGKVHRIEYATEPLSTRMVPSRGDVIGVLEFVAGTADRIGLGPGDVIDHPSLIQD
ncbi:MAG: DUF192 domain-containing protein [Pseudomonadota bacterium]